MGRNKSEGSPVPICARCTRGRSCSRICILARNTNVTCKGTGSGEMVTVTNVAVANYRNISWKLSNIKRSQFTIELSNSAALNKSQCVGRALEARNASKGRGRITGARKSAVANLGTRNKIVRIAASTAGGRNFCEIGERKIGRMSRGCVPMVSELLVMGE